MLEEAVHSSRSLCVKVLPKAGQELRWIPQPLRDLFLTFTCQSAFGHSHEKRH